ncbi:MAG TPA: trypsin-like peptidase domain-containing protein [Anaerolineales bacterium]|nr:trypsin-like peptidase domain-containing protein [Anaerolineales bacterium]
MSALSDFSKGLASAVEKASTYTVLVDARRRYPASGIAFGPDLVLTADHVVTREEDITISGADGKSLQATIAGRDPGSDLAVLRLSEKALSPAKTTDGLPKVAELVLAVGRPGKAGLQASWGIVTAIEGPARTGKGGLLEEYIQTETVSYPGFSGGPLINTEGEVLGLNTSGLAHGTALTIPVKVAWRVADALARYGSVKRGYLGVRTQTVNLPDASQKSLGRVQQQGLLVLWLEEGGPAEKAGLMVGDILVGVGGQRVSDPDDLFSTLNSDSVGKSIPAEVLRGGKPQMLTVTVAERK